jgi:P4 family phage/plasmid primase-like protien
MTEKPIKQDKCYSYAYSIKEGKHGIYLYCLEDDKFYNYKDGYWQPLFEVDFLGRIQESIPELTASPVGKRKQVVDNFKMLGRKHLEGFNWSELINLKNGMINPYDGILQEHDYLFYSTNRLPYSYIEDQKCELWIKTLNEILESDQKKIGILQEIFGYCLTRDTKHHKALLLLGESRSGKSTILQTLRNVIGAPNCSSVPLKYLSNAQYTAMLINKLVNIDTDVSAKAEQFEAEFKTITSGEPVSVNQKYVAAFDFVPYCKIVMAANIFPKITDHSSAFYNRLILIPCDRVFTPEEQNRNLLKELNKELPGILNWSIEGLKKLTARGKFESLDFMNDAVQELENENNPCNVFFDEHIEISFGDECDKSELFNHYKNWSDNNKQYAVSHVVFSRNLYKVFHKETPKQARSLYGRRSYVWKNIKYVPFKSSIVNPHTHQAIEVGSKNIQEINWGE